MGFICPGERQKKCMSGFFFSEVVSWTKVDLVFLFKDEEN